MMEHIWGMHGESAAETLLERERFALKPKSGGGLLRYEVWGFREKGHDGGDAVQPDLLQS
ncbi:MAG: hypothetical protein WKH97_15540 [Casimicrobiaceae bacterium]